MADSEWDVVPYQGEAAGDPWEAVDQTKFAQQGAPVSVRAAVGSVPAQARLQTIRKFFPDAEDLGNGNFIYTDPRTKQPTIYNRPGLDVGDIASLPAEVGEFIGSAAGGAAGGTAGAVGGPPGVLAGTMAGSGAGGTIGREFVQRGMMSALGVEDPRTAGEQATEAATTFGLNAIGPGVIPAIRGTVSGTTRLLMRGGTKAPAIQQAIDDLERFGASPSVAQATQSTVQDQLESVLARVPGAAGRIRRAAQDTAATVGESVNRKTRAMAGEPVLEPEVAGRAISTGVGEFTGRVMDRAEVLFGRVKGRFQPAEKVGVSNTSKTLTELSVPVSGAPAVGEVIGNPTVRRLQAALAEDAKDGTLSYEALSSMRSAIGRKLGTPSLVEDIPRGELKRLYGAISEDMRAAARAKGPAALQEFEHANKFYAAALNRIDETLQPLIANKTPEKIFKGFESGTREGASQARVLYRSLNMDQRRIVTSTIMDRLGKGAPGAQTAEGDIFSFNTFLTNWNRLNNTAKDTLLSSLSDAQVMKKDFDALARASSRMRESSRAFIEPTTGSTPLLGTAMVGGMLGTSIAYGDLTLPLIIATAGVGANTTARLITNKNFVRWLARSTDVSPREYEAYIGRLGAVAANSSAEDAAAVRDYADVLAGQQQGTQ